MNKQDIQQDIDECKQLMKLYYADIDRMIEEKSNKILQLKESIKSLEQTLEGSI